MSSSTSTSSVCVKRNKLKKNKANNKEQKYLRIIYPSINDKGTISSKNTYQGAFFEKRQLKTFVIKANKNRMIHSERPTTKNEQPT